MALLVTRGMIVLPCAKKTSQRVHFIRKDGIKIAGLAHAPLSAILVTDA